MEFNELLEKRRSVRKYKANTTVHRETIEEMQIAQCMFNYVSDPKLIEAAIYREDAAKKKFEYLLSLAKEKQMNKKIDM